MLQTEQKFLELCKEYACKSNALFHTYDKNKIKYVYSIFYNSIKIEFYFYTRAKSFVLPYTLFCRIYLRKSSPVFYHLPDIISGLDTKDFRCCYFPFIESPERMEACFRQLCAIVDANLTNNIDEILSRENELFEKMFDSYVKIFKLKDTSINKANIDDSTSYDHSYFICLQKIREEQTVGRFTTLSQYKMFLDGNFEAAKKLYEKMPTKGVLLPYESQLLEFMSQPQNKGFIPIHEECYSLKYATEEMTDIDMLKVCGIAFIVLGIAFCALFAVTNIILSHGAEFFFAVPWYFGFLQGAICALFGGIAFRHKIMRLYKKESKDRNAAIETISNPKWLDIFAKSVFAMALVFSLISSYGMLASYARFDKDIFTGVNTDSMLLIVQNTYDYDDIAGVYYISARHNIDGDRIDRPSYVIALKDGNTLDLDGYTSVKTSKKTVVPFLKEKGYDVIYLDSDKDLP